MKCDEVREILLSDYIDEEAAPEIRDRINDHVKGCNGCREMYDVLCEKVSAPFKNLEPTTPPFEVWKKIEEKIYTGREVGAVGFLTRLKSPFVYRKTVLALASVMLVVFFGTQYVKVRDSNLTKEYVTEQFEYLTSLGNNGNGGGFGTSIEEYFF